MSQPRLYPVACESKDFALTGYADTIICEPGIGNEASTLIGIRLGGEPAATQALATVLRTGAPFRITVDGNEFTCQGDKHKYSLQYGAAAPYSEALLTIQDEEIEGKEKVRGRESTVSFIKSRVHFLYGCRLLERFRLSLNLQANAGKCLHCPLDRPQSSE